MKEINKKLLPVYVTLGVVLLFGGSYALFSETLLGEKKYNLSSGDLRLYLDESETTNSISLTNVMPVSDEDGMLNDSYQFSLVNEGDEELNYTIYLKEEEYDKQTPASVIRYYYSRDIGNINKIKNLVDSIDKSGNYYLEKGVIPADTTYNYEFKMWINYDAGNEIAGTQCSLYLEVYAEQVVKYVDNSGANSPELTSGMIPVTYNETDKTWVKADISEKWYDYDNQMWANAVTVTEATRASYMDADAGEPISMNDINTMWVWIPKYEYQYTDLGDSYAGGTQTEPGEIKINFISNDTITPSDSTKYQIPEGFKFGGENIPGFWIGKFETSTLESCTAAVGSINTGCDLTTLTPQVKPNVTSWRGARISTFFEVGRLMQSSDNADIYGFDVEGTSSMDTHMLKNTEWGIVAMLSQSRYGKYGNPSYSSTNREIYINQSLGFLTGNSNGHPSLLGMDGGDIASNNQVTYDTVDTGYGASTTGTIYGVYDMSGGTNEYVMGNSDNYIGESGFITLPDSKYYDLYLFPENSWEIAGIYKVGDATHEVARWYNDDVDSGSGKKWFLRGGGLYSSALDTSSGVFLYYTFGTGESDNYTGFRLAIKP